MISMSEFEDLLGLILLLILGFIFILYGIFSSNTLALTLLGIILVASGLIVGVKLFRK
jgi:hypothetical protein